MDPEQGLRRHRRKLAADPEATALFDCLVEHRFDPALDRTFLTRKCGATRRVRERLAAKIGPLKDFVTRLRMEEAKRLYQLALQQRIHALGRNHPEVARSLNDESELLFDLGYGLADRGGAHTQPFRRPAETTHLRDIIERKKSVEEVHAF